MNLNELPADLRGKVNRYKPIAVNGFLLHPIRVRDYLSFLQARPAIEYMQQRMKFPLISMPLLSAYYKLDFDLMTQGQAITGLLSKTMLFLALALRLSPDEETPNIAELFGIKAERGRPDSLEALCCTIDGEAREITPADFEAMRPVLAAQNGLTIQPKDANPELVDCEAEIAQINAANLDADPDHMIAAVAALTGTDENEIGDWAILKLNRRAESFKRMLDYMICGFAESSGMVKFTKGNPFPNPYFPRKKEGTTALSALNSFGGGAVERAVGNPNAKTT